MEFLVVPHTTVVRLMHCLHCFTEGFDSEDACFNYHLSPLACAVYYGDADKVVELLKQGAEVDEPAYSSTVNYDTPIAISLKYQRFQILGILLRHCSGNTYKTESCTKVQTASGKQEVDSFNSVRLILSYCKDQQLCQSVKLHLMYWAIKHKNVQTVCDLLNFGVNANLPFCNEGSFLHIAVRTGNLEIFKLLLEKEADVNTNDQLYETPLFGAIRTNNLDMATKLIEQGADVNVQNLELQTPLHIAATSVHDSIELVKLLLRHGAYLNILDHFGNTPLSLNLDNFMLHNTFSITKCLVQHGSLPVHANEMEALKWAVVHSHNVELLRFVDRAGTRCALDTGTAEAKALFTTFQSLWTWLFRKQSSAHRPIPAADESVYCNSQTAASLHDMCHAKIRILLIKHSNGRSIHDSVHALPLPDLLQRRLLLED